MSFLRKWTSKTHTLYMNLSIRFKMQIFFFIIIIFVAVILGSYSYIISSRNVENEVSIVNLRDTKQIGSSIGFLQKDVDDLSTFICIDPSVQSFIRSSDRRISLEPIDSLLASKSYISYIGIYSKDGDTYYISNDSSIGINSFDNIKKSSIYEQAIKLRGAPLWIPLDEKNQIFITDNKHPKIAMVRALMDINTYNVSGFMVICINQSSLQRIYSDSINTLSSSVVIFDQNNSLVSYSSNNSIIKENSSFSFLHPYMEGLEGKNIINLNNTRFLLTFSTIAESGWKIAYLVPVAGILKSLGPILSMTAGVILSCLIVAFIIATYISHILTSPIKKLLASMRRVKKGDLKEKVDFKYNDEIGMLGAEYNDMIDNIHDLINKVYKLQIQEREAELKALQAQINPHFLYNTLDTIFWKAEKYREKDISEMVYSLSRLFRLTLNSGNEFIQVRGEKELIEHYLLLQSRRYRDKLFYEIDIDESILDYLMPKLILQPFVENSIIHGTEKDNGRSLIQVKGSLCSDKIHFTIQDDGKGMSNETINEQLNIDRISDRNHRNRKGYAIGNVKQRLELYYKNDFSLNIFSEPGKGTKVEIIIPAIQQEVV